MNYLIRNTQLYHLDLITTFPQKQMLTLCTLNLKLTIKVHNLPETEISHLKTKLRSACKKYNTIKIPYKDREIINKLSKNPQIILLHQGKGRGIVIMDKGKCINILNTK